MPYCDADRQLADRLYSVTKTACELGDRRQRHKLVRVYCGPDGIVEPFHFGVRPNAGPYTCGQMVCGIADWLPVGCPFLWLEPDCCPTRATFLDEIEDLFDLRVQDQPELCLFGHDKRDMVLSFRFVNGACVYRTTPTLLAALREITYAKPHDQQLGELLMADDQGGAFHRDTNLIRCIWGWQSEPYLEDLRYDVTKALHAFPNAALIHGDKSGALLRAVWGDA